MSKSLRDEMPTVAAIVDEWRAVFGKDMVDAQIRAGINGKPTFYASENGHEIGTPDNSAPGIKLSETLVGPMALPKKRGAR